MKLFLSWSGETSKEVASVLKDGIPLILQSVKIFFSPSDIEKGAKWDNEITENLKECPMGIICITPDNMNNPWILFEAGALSLKLDKANVCPLLFGLSNSDLTGPLATFQTTTFKEDDFKALICDINRHLGDAKLSDDALNRSFNAFFPDINTNITEALKTKKAKPKVKERTEREILDEILEITRRLSSNNRPVEQEKPLALSAYSDTVKKDNSRKPNVKYIEAKIMIKRTDDDKLNDDDRDKLFTIIRECLRGRISSIKLVLPNLIYVLTFHLTFSDQNSFDTEILNNELLPTYYILSVEYVK